MLDFFVSLSDLFRPILLLRL